MPKNTKKCRKAIQKRKKKTTFTPKEKISRVMEEKTFFTAKEREQLFTLYKRLLHLSGDTLQKNDCRKLKTHLIKAVAEGSMPRNNFGMNPIIKDMQTAVIVAEEIGINAEDVLVIDVRDGTVALDILQKRLDPSKFIAKEERILRRLRDLKGITLSEEAHISSNGMLGWIVGNDADIEEGLQAMEMSQSLVTQIKESISNRVIVFPTGTEVERGEIEDTNTPLIMGKFAAAGFSVDKGEILKDDVELFSRKLWRAAEKGYSVSITTGGVGAENKDHSVEAVLRLDPQACTPYIAKFQIGHGRHSKDGIRIAVGQLGLTTFIALPGPNDEVSVCIDTVVRGISEGWSKEILAGELARILRTRLKEKIGVMMHYHHNA